MPNRRTGQISSKGYLASRDDASRKKDRLLRKDAAWPRSDDEDNDKISVIFPPSIIPSGMTDRDKKRVSAAPDDTPERTEDVNTAHPRKRAQKGKRQHTLYRTKEQLDTGTRRIADDEGYRREYRELEETETPRSFDKHLRQCADDSIESKLDDWKRKTVSSKSSDGVTNNRSRRDKLRELLPVLSKSISTALSSESQPDHDEYGPFTFMAASNLSEYFVTRQDTAFCAILLACIQLLILLLQLTMCGVAPFDVNMMIGPFPDAFSEWGGKNPYLMLEENQWWRMVTPAFLHVGILHFVANTICQFTAISLFEREWGSLTWLFVWLLSTIGCSASSNFFDDSSIAVGSSGTLIGLYTAKLAQVVTFTLFETRDTDGFIRPDHLTFVLFGFVIQLALTSFTYIDWSGTLGGLLTGFLAGILVFSSSIADCCGRFWWAMLGLLSLIGSLVVAIYFFVETSEPDEQLSDVCQYFRSLFPENYECGCMWE